MPPMKSSSDVLLCGLACRDPYGEPRWYGYVGESIGPERKLRRSAVMDLDKMMRETVKSDPWTWGSLRILQ